jgi:hypothetical protein
MRKAESMTKVAMKVRIEELAQEVWEMLATDATDEEIEEWLLSHGVCTAQMRIAVYDYVFLEIAGGTITIGPPRH